MRWSLGSVYIERIYISISISIYLSIYLQISFVSSNQVIPEGGARIAISADGVHIDICVNLYIYVYLSIFPCIDQFCFTGSGDPRKWCPGSGRRRWRSVHIDICVYIYIYIYIYLSIYRLVLFHRIRWSQKVVPGQRSPPMEYIRCIRIYVQIHIYIYVQINGIDEEGWFQVSPNQMVPEGGARVAVAADSVHIDI